jgi:hypothetical protein
MVAPTPEAVLSARIQALRTRIRLLLAQRWAVRAVLIAAALAASAALVLRQAGTPLPPEWLAPAFLFAAAGGALWGWNRKISAMDAARLADQRLGLKERLSSGLEIAEGRCESPLAPALIEDAARHGALLQPAEVFPWRLPREGRWLALAAVLLAGVFVLPELPFFQSPREQAERAALRREGRRIESIAREVEKRKELGRAEVSRRVAENMRRLGIQMQRGQVDKKRAMLASNRLTNELKQAQRQAAGPQPAKTLAQAAADLRAAAGGAGTPRRPPRVRRRGEGREGVTAGRRLHQAPGTRYQAPERNYLDRVAAAIERRDLDAAGKALQALAEKLKSGSLSPEETRAAEEALARMSKALEGSDLDAAAKQLAQAAKQLEAARRLASSQQGKLSETQRRQLMARAADACAQAGGT